MLLTVACVLAVAAVVHGADDGSSEKVHYSGEMYVFGRVGLKTEPFFLNDSVPNDYVQNPQSPFRTVTAGPNVVGVIFPDGHVARLDNPFSDGSLQNPIDPPSESGFCQICKGSMHTVAVTCGGDLYTWGGRSTKRYPDDPELPANFPIPLDVRGERVLQISCGENHTLILTEERNVYSFGSTSYGRLGVDVPEDTARLNDPQLVTSLVKDELPINDSVCFVEAGGKSSFAITESGDMYVWGANEFGQLALGFVSYSVDYPKRIVTDPEFKACEVAAAKEFAIGYDDKGDVWTWGAGEGIPERFGGADLTKQVFSILEERAVQVAAGEFHVAALTDADHVYTFGYNRFGQLGVVLDTEMPTEKPENSTTEPESPIWTLVPREVTFLTGKDIGGIYAAGNYTIAHAHVKAPLNCPCARGGRKPTEFKVPGRVEMPMYKPVPPVKQPEREPSDVFAPVAPYVGKKRIAVLPTLPGEVVESPALTMDDVRPAFMANDLGGRQNLPELAPRPAVMVYYPQDSPEARAFEKEGAERGAAQTLFGRHITEEGYYYGDYDSEVASAAYHRQAVMASAKKGGEQRQPQEMPEPGSDMAMGGSSVQAPAPLNGVFSLSLQDVHLGHGNDEGDAMLAATLGATNDFRDSNPPYEFEDVPNPVEMDLLSTEVEAGKPSPVVDEAPAEAGPNALLP